MPTSLTPSLLVTEAQLQYTMTTKNTVLRAHLMLAGVMGPIEVLRHFQDRFIMESNNLMKKGYSLEAGQDHLCSHAAWMQSPLEADTSSERLRPTWVLPHRAHLAVREVGPMRPRSQARPVSLRSHQPRPSHS